ncbi:hypothetical protein ACOMHN_028656 [Nucella lapillus]
MTMVLSARMPAGVPKSMTAESDNKASRTSGRAYTGPFLSAGSPLDARSAGPAGVWPIKQPFSRQATVLSPFSGAVSCPPSTSPMSGAVSTQDVTSSSSQLNSLSCFRPVGVVLKGNQSALAMPAPTTVEGQGQDAKSALLYCAPTGSLSPWTTATSNWTSSTSFGAWPQDSKVLLDSKGHVRPYSQPLPDNTLQPSYGAYPYSQTYHGNGQASYVSSMAGAESHVAIRKKSPSQLEYGAAQFSGQPFQDARNYVKGTHYVSVDNLKEPAYPANQSSNTDVNSVIYPSTTVGCVSQNVSVVTVRADDTSLFMANTTGTTSLTEREFSLHDAKMQLDEGTGLSCPPAPPSSPYSSLCALPCGGADDRPPAQPSTAEEVKPHPGLDMLSDVSLLVESLKSQGTAGRSRSSQCAASSSSSSSTAVSSMECGSYASEEDTEAALCPPQATYVGTLLPDPDSTMTLPAVGPGDGSLLPQEDLEYTAMTPASVLHQADCFPLEGLQQQYTLMLPPKKSTKFTRESGTHQLSASSSHQSRSSLKNSDDMDSGREKSVRHVGGRKKRENQDEVTSKACGSGTKKRRKSPKSKSATGKYTPSSDTQLPGDPRRKATSPSKKQVQEQSSERNRVGGREEHSCFEPDTQSTSVHKTVCESKNTKKSLLTPVAPRQGLMTPVAVSCTLVPQVGPGGDGASSFTVCKSEEHNHGLLYTTDISVAQLEAAALPTASEAYATDPPVNMRVEEYEDICHKVHFDPLVIAEEEVTSTQPHDVFLTDNTDVSADDHRKRKKRKRKKSHSCVSCSSTPSSDEESVSSHSKTASSARTSSSHNSIKSCRKCRRSVKGSKSSDGTSSSKENTMEWRDRPRLPCKVCGRTFASSSNLSRHQHIFHPSLFLPDKHVMEIPLASPQCFASCTSVSLASSVNSGDSTPPMFSPKSLTCLLTPPPCTALPSVKIPPTPHNSPCEAPSTSSSQTWQGGEVYGAEFRQQGDPAPELAAVHSPRRRRRLLRQQDREWKPPKKWEPAGSDGRGGERVTRRAGGGVKVGRMTTRRKQTRPLTPASSPLVKCSLNFRTKKRTRINSTIPCPYCQRLFSVMSNLKRHTKQQHSDVNVFVCNVCSYKINMRRKLNKHMKQVHLAAFPHTCTDCLARFRTEAEVKAHGTDHDIARFPCDDCKLTFYTKEHLEDHISHYHVTVYVSD